MWNSGCRQPSETGPEYQLNEHPKRRTQRQMSYLFSVQYCMAGLPCLFPKLKYRAITTRSLSCQVPR
ncbi:unnamed protein product [Peniophora sp. CBMAI 1063]|nr:unnamed protein product [Peniophora sp. CBMAI 1063]